MVYLSIWLSLGFLSFLIMYVDDAFQDIVGEFGLPRKALITATAIVCTFMGAALFAKVTWLQAWLAADYIKTSIHAAFCRYKVKKSSHSEKLAKHRTAVMARRAACEEEMTQYDINLIDITLYDTLKNIKKAEKVIEQINADHGVTLKVSVDIAPIADHHLATNRRTGNQEPKC